MVSGKLSKSVKDVKSKISGILKKNKVIRAGIFGSFARGEEEQGSDIDILVEFDGSLLDLVRLEMEIEKVLNRKVDLLTYGGISPYLKNRILREEVRII